MTNEILHKANDLKKKIDNLERYLTNYAIPNASCKHIKISTTITKSFLKCKNWIGEMEYELDEEEYALVNEALQKQLQLYKEEFNQLGVIYVDNEKCLQKVERN